MHPRTLTTLCLDAPVTYSTNHDVSLKEFYKHFKVKKSMFADRVFGVLGTTCRRSPTRCLVVVAWSPRLMVWTRVCWQTGTAVES